MPPNRENVRIGCGSGGGDDRREPAVKMVQNGDVEYLCCDRLAERTLANSKRRMLEDPSAGYNPQLVPWFSAVLPEAIDRDVTIIGNFGAANVPAAGRKVAGVARELGYDDVEIATITGDDVLDAITDDDRDPDLRHLVSGEPLSVSEPLLAHAYIGADAVVDAIERDADVIIGGRIADLSMFLAPMIYEFGWKPDELDKLANGATIAHLLECGMYGTGANIYQPGYVEVPGLDDLPLPLAEVEPNGHAVVSKPEDTGGVVNELSLGNQLAHEIHDPTDYKTPDLVIDVSQVELKEVGPDKVYVSGATGKPRPEEYKALVGYRNGYIAQIDGGWAGSQSYEKAKVTRDRILKPKLEAWDYYDQLDEWRFDVVGVDAIHGPVSGEPECDPNEVRLRVAARVDSREAADDLAVLMKMALWMSAAGAGGVQTKVQPNITIEPTTVPRDFVEEEISIMRASEEADAADERSDVELGRA